VPRIAATLLAGVLFVFLIPLFLVRASSALDGGLGIPRFAYGLPNRVVGGILLLAGLALALWSIAAQLTRGKGTPIPVIATQALLTAGPFRLCRNPMSLGTIVLYLGLGIVLGSLSAIAIVLLLASLLILYILRIEERELAERFGAAYLAYKERTPFLIPRIGPRRPRSKGGGA
jgi:protein-S-isoprenylcysteine O-methyltransferase Ste14